jgi:hypothetical protein
MLTIQKYPRTQHIEGSRLQPGDEDLHSVPFAELAGRYLVVEEKLDGANAGICFDESGRLWLQSRGHFLTGGLREKHFNLFKQWAHTHADALRAALGDRYVLYGEWLYAKHTIYYDQLPHYFLEFDVLDRQTGEFLSTDRRQSLLAASPMMSVPVLHRGLVRTLDELLGHIGPALYKGPAWRERLAAECSELELDADRIAAETDRSDLMEGLYIKVEEEGRVVGRYKYVRADFLTAVLDSGSHWLKRPIVPNRLRDGVDLFGSRP